MKSTPPIECSAGWQHVAVGAVAGRPLPHSQLLLPSSNSSRRHAENQTYI